MGKRRNITANYIWRLAEKIGANGVTFIVSIVLARIIDPDAYGTIALVTVFINIISVFVDGGLGNSLIQKKDADDIDFSSVFHFNMLCCIVIYGILYAIAPFVSDFYGIPELTPLTRVLSITIIISGLKNIQQAYVSKNLLFKKFFFSTLGGTIISAIIGIYMAYNGYGVWALVAQTLTNNAIDTLILWITVPFRPKRKISFKKLFSLLSYGWKLLAAHLLDNVYKNLRSLLIGKVYTTSDLAFYNKGNQFPRLFITNTVSSLDSILFPVMSGSQDDKSLIKKYTRTVNKVTTYIVCPFMMGLAICSRTMVSLLLTDKWLPCVPYMQILCISYIFWPIYTTNLNAIKAIGRSDIFIKLEIIKKTIGILVIVISLQYGVLYIAIGELLVAPIHAVINAYPNRQLISYKLHEQFFDILPNILISSMMGICVYLLSIPTYPNLLKLIAQVVTGVIVYIILSVYTKNEGFYYLLSLAKK